MKVNYYGIRGDHLTNKSWFTSSVTRLGNLLDFVQLFKAFGNN